LIAETSPSDADFIRSSYSTDHSQTVKLSTLADPALNTGHILHVRARLDRSPPNGSHAGRVNIYVMQGTTQISVSLKTFPDTSTWQDLTYTLTAGEADSITDYSDLRIKVASQNCGDLYSIYVSQAYLEVPLITPIVTTQTVTENVGSTVTGRGTIVTPGDTLTQYGHVWDTNVNPTVVLSTKTELGSTSSAQTFTSAVTGLVPGTAYYIRAYATNSETNTGYGENVYFVASKVRQGHIWMEGNNLHGFDENAIERTYVHTDDLDDAPIDGALVPITSNWAYDHVAAADPHTGYRLESADHNHQSTGAEAGQLDHGLALTGLGDDDHTQYVLKSTYDAQTILAATSDNTPVALTVGEQTLVGRITGGNVAALSTTQIAQLLHLLGVHHSLACTYISGSGTAGTDNTAQTVKSVTLPANTCIQVGDRIRIRVYWKGDTGGAVTATTTLNGVTVAHTTDLGGTSYFIDEVYLHYIDATHANIIETEAGALGALSVENVAGFDWANTQAINVDQDAIVSNHIVVIAVIVDSFPKGII
jgi:hypothetical protein